MPREALTPCRFHPLFSFDSANTLTTMGFIRSNAQTKFFLECAGKSSAHRMWLPAGCLANLRDGGPIRTLEHCNHLSLLAVFAQDYTGQEAIRASNGMKFGSTLEAEQPGMA
ncbi:hypothetical protein [Xanthomonas albilineans]|uniref:hypothetical protein n=1 Tax=Xanthomonas albilineans TaxID=29447 RepID=UPI003CE5AC78